MNKINISNVHNLPLSISVFLATNDYDLQTKKEKNISATSLLKSTRQIILTDRVDKTGLVMDVSSLISSRLGSAIHDGIEKAWTSEKLSEVLQDLNIPKSIRNQIKINPNNPSDCIPVYLEQRASKTIEGWEVSGKFDFVFNGALEDFKTTSVYSYQNQSNRDKYILQGSIYRWLNPEKITDDHMTINYIFSDWSNNKARVDKDYPPFKIWTQKFHLLSLVETESYIRKKLRELDKYWNTPEEELPYCTDSELWRTAPKWKYYSSHESKRATKVFNNPHDAAAYSVGKKGFVEEVKGTARACAYCAAFTICSQKDSL